MKKVLERAFTVHFYLPQFFDGKKLDIIALCLSLHENVKTMLQMQRESTT